MAPSECSLGSAWVSKRGPPEPHAMHVPTMLNPCPEFGCCSFLSAQLCKIHRAEVLAPQRDGPHNWEDSGSSPGASSRMRHGRQKKVPSQQTWFGAQTPVEGPPSPWKGGLRTSIVNFVRPLKRRDQQTEHRVMFVLDY